MRPTFAVPSAASHELPTSHEPRGSVQAVLQELRGSSLILAEDWEALADDRRQQLLAAAHLNELWTRLVEYRLLTSFQVERIKCGDSFGLILGNYRLQDVLGSGGMGVVYRAEHMRLRREAALKVLTLSHGQDLQMLLRFFNEIRAVAQLQHPNIVAAIDAGEVAHPRPDQPVLHYFVMEYVPGQNLKDYVQAHGPLPVAKACDLVHQVASALAEAHRHHLVHRDIKPSNIRVTPDDQAKLLDFGLARHFRHRFTEPGLVLGTIDYIAPEQLRSSSEVDIRADIYGLGGTLYWCLTSRPPFESRGSFAQDVAYRLQQAPPSARFWRPDLPEDLDAVIMRMMALDPADRYQTPEAVMRALLPFVKTTPRQVPCPGLGEVPVDVRDRLLAAPAARGHRVLIVDDEPYIRHFCATALQADGLSCEESASGIQALELLHAQPFDLVLLDVDMPGLSGTEVCKRLRQQPPGPNFKIVMFSGRATSDDLSQMLLADADDYLTKPFSVVQLRARIQAALRLKEAQDRSDRLNHQLRTVNAELERNLTARDNDLVHARNALVLALAKLVEHRHTESGAHLQRLQRYCRALAEQAAQLPAFADRIDAPFIHLLECCAPLHDIGKVGLPDDILLKPGKLADDERIIMQSHTLIGAETLAEVARQHGSALAFLQMAIDIARHHHERWDGTGYPDRLAGEAIPLAARVVTICDVYDTLRCRQTYKPALSHAAALQLMLEASPGQFDPLLLQALQQCAPRLERIFQELSD
jgi:response regulator RpfG family c-di-GMP phosphodiesterase